MNELVDEIRRGFAETSKGSAIALDKIDGRYKGWVVRFSDTYGVAVPYCAEEPLVERFHSARLHQRFIQIGGEELSCLLLTSNAEGYRNEFALLCADFIDPGEDGERRQRLLEKPLQWWERWTDLLGNAVANKKVYSILGELLVLEKILQKGDGPCRWGGVEYAVHDIETEGRAYEVKSTLKRYGTTVTISSQFQLEQTDRPLSLVFCRFEETLAGDSIDAAVERLTALGMDEDALEHSLTLYKIEKGTSARRQNYRLLEMREYEVDEEFPLISSESFKENRIPDSIVEIAYTVDLLGLCYVSWMD